MRQDTSLLPERDAREAALFFVVAALCFLAALAALSAKASYSAAKDWSEAVQGEFTIRLRDTDRRAADEALNLVRATDGVVSARLLDRDEITRLLEPSFGRGGLPAGLPLPDILAVRGETDATDLDARLSDRLRGAGLDAVVDAHADWASDVARALGIVRVSALSVVALLVATALSVIAFATHAALLARRDIVDVLHLSGATDRYIARLFERRFWMLGLRAGVVGALFALGGAALALFFASSSSGRSGLLPELGLDLQDLTILLSTPVVAAIAARLAARFTVMRALRASS